MNIDQSIFKGNSIFIQHCHFRVDSILIEQLAIQCEKLNVYSILNQYFKSNLRADVFLKGKTIQIQKLFNVDSPM